VCAQASKASVERDREDSENCQVVYAPEHNLDMALFAAMMAGDYDSANWAAGELMRTQKLHMPGYISQGTNYAAVVEAALFFGRCITQGPHDNVLAPCVGTLRLWPSFWGCPAYESALVCLSLLCYILMGYS